MKQPDRCERCFQPAEICMDCAGTPSFVSMLRAVFVVLGIAASFVLGWIVRGNITG